MNTDTEATTRNISAMTRQSLSLSLQALSATGQAEIARCLNLSTSTVSRIKSERLEEVIKVLSACGLKIVPQDYSGDYAEFIDAALVFACYGLKAIRKDHGLLAED